MRSKFLIDLKHASILRFLRLASMFLSLVLLDMDNIQFIQLDFKQAVRNQNKSMKILDSYDFKIF